MNSKLYKCMVMHNRTAPKKHRFTYNIFMFWIDIDELPLVEKKLWLFSRNKFNLFSFYDKDHFKYPKKSEKNNDLIRKRIKEYLDAQHISEQPEKIFLLTNTRVLGHVFNPVSFYFCFDNTHACNYVITETANTFGEMKMFLVDQKIQDKFHQNTIKYFYVSPFTELDQQFEFHYTIPTSSLHIKIDVLDTDGKKFFVSTLTGEEKKLTDLKLLEYFFRFPFVTLKIITAIHWQAFILWLKKVPYHKKKDNPDLQKEITNV